MEELNSIIINIARIEVIKSELGQEVAEYIEKDEPWGYKFVNWCISQSTDNLVKDIKDAKIHLYDKNDIEIGDIIVFAISKDTYHYGIIHKLDNKYIYTIEGSTRRCNLSGLIYRGDDVANRYYSIGYPRIRGIIKPSECICNEKKEIELLEYSGKEFRDDIRRLLNLSSDATIETIVQSAPPISIKTSPRHRVVLPVQKRLAALGYYKGQIDDNQKATFNDDVSAALLKFQKDNVPNIPKCSFGTLGAKSPTWAALLEV